MKTHKILLILAVSAVAFLSSCESNPAPKPMTTEELSEATGKTFRTIKDAFNKGYKDSVPVVKESEAHPYINPVLIYGSSFGEFFQVLYKTGKFEDMLAFTSSRSIQKFGRDKVLNFYKTMEFTYNIKLKSMNVAETPIDVTVLNYTAGIMATKSMLRMDVVVENDSCKIVLKNLKSLR